MVEKIHCAVEIQIAGNRAFAVDATRTRRTHASARAAVRTIAPGIHACATAIIETDLARQLARPGAVTYLPGRTCVEAGAAEGAVLIQIDACPTARIEGTTAYIEFYP